MVFPGNSKKLFSCIVMAFALKGCAMSNTHDSGRGEVAIPQEDYILVEFKQFGLPGFATINSALSGFSYKGTFNWHMSILIEADQLRDYGLPSSEEQEILYSIEDELDPELKANGNAVFFARVTYDGKRELIYRLKKPEPAHRYMQSLTKSDLQERTFDYRIDFDKNWDKAKWYLDAVEL